MDQQVGPAQRHVLVRCLWSGPRNIYSFLLNNWAIPKQHHAWMSSDFPLPKTIDIGLPSIPQDDPRALPRRNESFFHNHAQKIAVTHRELLGI